MSSHQNLYNGTGSEKNGLNNWLIIYRDSTGFWTMMSGHLTRPKTWGAIQTIQHGGWCKKKKLEMQPQELKLDIQHLMMQMGLKSFYA